MKDSLNISSVVTPVKTITRAIIGKVRSQGYYKCTHTDAAGNIKGEYILSNGVTNIGKNTLLDIMFGATAKISNWYAGLINNSGYTGVADADTMSSHAGWAEFTAYSAGTRPAWTTGAASGQAISNPTPFSYTMSSGGTIKGIFVVSDASKGGTAGTLWSTALLASNITVVASDILSFTYVVSL